MYTRPVTHSLLLFACSALLFPLGAEAQWDRVAKSPSALEAALELRLGDQRRDCNLSWRARERNDRKLSSIPGVVRRRILSQPQDIDTSWRDRGARALFSYIFPSPSLQVSALGPERELPVALVGHSDIPEPDSLQSSNVYSQTCISFARLALKGNVRPIPVATLQMAASRQDTVSSAVVLARGRFKSPLYASLGASGAHGLRTRLGLWEHYRSRKDALFGLQPAPRHYVTTFTGVLFLEQTLRGTTAGGSITGSAGGNFIVGSLTVDAELSTQRASEMRSRTFDTFIFLNSGGDPIVTWDTLPSPAAIAAGLRTEVAPKGITTDPKVVLGVPAAVERQVEGIPPALCDNNRWSLRTSDTRIHSGVVEERTGACVFKVGFTTAIDSARYTLPFTFWEANPIGSDTLSIPFNVELSRTPHPILRAGPQMQRVAAAQNDIVFHRRWVDWTVPVEFVDSDARVEFAGTPTDGTAELRCRSASPDTLVARFASADAVQRIFIYKIERMLGPEESFSTTPGDYDVCDLEVNLQIPIVNQVEVANKSLIIRDVIRPRINPIPSPPEAPDVPSATGG